MSRTVSQSVTEDCLFDTRTQVQITTKSKRS